MDALDRRIVNGLQGGFPICERPYAEAAAELGTDEATLVARLKALKAAGTLSRFGPMYHAERLGGALTLAAMAVPEDDFDRVAEIVNAFPEVAHNYAREHALNMWFVLATETPERIPDVLAAIEAATGHTVYDMPKIEEFFIGLRVEA
ncbi:MAG: AsnC family transcriptional regulator [Alphaproteobacteria bacterium]|nr:AsnC family transcriptional regulator [Alphaproteobacteria bacterium]